MTSKETMQIPFANPEVYLNFLRVIAAKEFGSIRPIAFKNAEGDSTVTSLGSVAYSTVDQFINKLTDANYTGGACDGVITATLRNKDNYTLKDLQFDSNVSVDGEDALMRLSSKGDFTVYFRWGKGYYTAQENAALLASHFANVDMRGLVPFASNHTILNTFTFEGEDDKFEVGMDSKDKTSVADVLKKAQENINNIKVM